MFKLRYQITRLQNMGKEFIRLSKLYMFKNKRGENHFQFEWKMNDYRSDTTFGRPYKLLSVYGDPKNPSWCRPWYDDNGNEVKVARDLYDQILDTVLGILKLFWRNIFVIETCTHPHDKVWIEWDGEREYGYTKQHRCNACGGYLSVEDVDRYLPPESRRPMLIKGNHTHPFDRRGPSFPHLDPLHEESFYLDYLDS